MKDLLLRTNFDSVRGAPLTLSSNCGENGGLGLQSNCGTWFLGVSIGEFKSSWKSLALSTAVLLLKRLIMSIFLWYFGIQMSSSLRRSMV
jgi:hypothetical protein